MEESVIRDPMGGVNQVGLRNHNERLVLTLIQRHGFLASADIARRTNLSAQTISIIIRALEKDGLLTRGEPLRGKVGKPSVPMALNPDSVLSYGLNIGRRSVDLVLVDFLGNLRHRLKQTYSYPTPNVITKFLTDGLKSINAELKETQKNCVCGIGVSAPFELWNWLDKVKAPKEEMLAWKGIDLQAEVEQITGLDTLIENDATSACTAEHMFGRGREFADYAYFFIGSFIGGGVVLNDTVYTGRKGNAGAFGSLPVGDTSKPDAQLIQNASIYLLEEKLKAAGIDPTIIWKAPMTWTGFDAQLDEWIDKTAYHLAVAAVAVSSVIDFEAVMVEGSCPEHVRHRIVVAAREIIKTLDTQGILEPVLIEATIGPNARAVGAASLPILSKYLLRQPEFV